MSISISGTESHCVDQYFKGIAGENKVRPEEGKHLLVLEKYYCEENHFNKEQSHKKAVGLLL